VQDSRDESLIFQDVFEAVCDELETAPLTLFNMISEALKIRDKEQHSLAEVIEAIQPEEIKLQEAVPEKEMVRMTQEVLEQMRSLMEQSEHMQVYLQVAQPTEIQEMIDTLIYDMITAQFGVS